VNLIWVMPAEGVLVRRSILVTVLCLAAWTAATVPAQAQPARDRVSVALDWTPNTNHTGIYVAEKLGYYRAAGIDLAILPYASTAPETLVSHRKADFGFSYSAGVAFARAAGADVTSVFAVLQHTALEIGVRADRSDIATPRDLDGKTYAGFGTPDEKPLLQTVIRAAGGKGVFRDVTLNTSAYDAVYRGKADSTLPLATWEVIQARLAGKPLKTFELSRYGVPPEYSALIASSNGYLRANPGLARRFLAATTRGYEYATAHPRAAARILIAANKQVLTQPQLVYESAALMARSYYRDTSGGVGRQSLGVWKGYLRFLFAHHALSDADGHKLTRAPAPASYFTNAYLPRRS
jgi:ABC-type nitrate/sulfonate/bicarbonate transport system substrate-binding protein